MAVQCGKLHRCTFGSCNCTFRTEAQLHRHLVNRSADRPCKCAVCLHSSRTLEILKWHLQVHSTARPFVCQLCQASFKYRFILKTHHQSVHSDKKPYKCNDCPAKFSTRGNLRSHRRRQHNPARPGFRCAQCGYRFYNKNKLQGHLATHATHAPPIKCAVCNGNYRSIETLRSHMRDVHSAARPSFFCDRCSASFRLRSGLERHRRIHIGERPFKCSDCDRRFGSAEGLAAHRMRRHSVDRPKCLCALCLGKFSSKLTLRERLFCTHKLTFKKRAFRCEICLSEYATAHRLRTHKYQQHRRPTYACSRCGKRLGTKSNVPKHLRSLYINAKPFACARCLKRFLQRSTLRQHMLHHTGRNNPRCDACNLRFESMERLESHRKRVHWNTSTYGCSLCEQYFTVKKLLFFHITKLHYPAMASEIWPFACDVCGKRFRAPPVQHMRRCNAARTACTCVVCGKAFSGPLLLRRHQVKTHSACCYACLPCGRAFKDAEALRSHDRSHRPKLPCGFGTCKRKFVTQQTLLKHQAMHGGGRRRYVMPPQCARCGIRRRDRDRLWRHMQHNCNAS